MSKNKICEVCGSNVVNCRDGYVKTENKTYICHKHIKSGEVKIKLGKELLEKIKENKK